MVQMITNRSVVGSATGFFYTGQEQLFFVTNRHVVLDEQRGHRPDSLALRLHTNAADVRQNQEYTVSLYAGDKHRWHEHPVHGSKVDVVAIPLPSQEIRGHFVVKAFSAANLVPDDVALSIGEDVLVLGFPLGFHDSLHNLPIVRQATLASVYPVPFNGDPFVLVDGRLHRGTSGSPVITKPTNMLRKANGSIEMLVGQGIFFLVGVHSAMLDIKGRDPTKDEPLGLNCVWFGTLVKEIVGS
jgi:S1-C subfamily serine protease